jgi:hypothetical protein
MMWWKGYAAEETMVAFECAADLAALTETADGRFAIYFGRWAARLVRGEFREAEDVAKEFLQLAETEKGLAVHPADLRRRASVHSIPDRSQRQKPPALVPVLRPTDEPPKLLPNNPIAISPLTAWRKILHASFNQLRRDSGIAHESASRAFGISVRDNRLVRMALIPAPVAAPDVVDRRLRLPLLHLERRDQGVLSGNGDCSPIAGDIYTDCEFEHHARIPSKAISHHAASRRLGLKQ